ncbi:ribonuclease H-like protein [Trichodelitschia bisporula]|uniref:poly(A)-specific ribonuclease n=1 Tax=Trichodelitschia bisporula TaxID=703511 RepID=A0A6G1I8L7_9PEZI|nr:ribonuclease H-like protein [Trichodelitschia bisporula]
MPPQASRYPAQNVSNPFAHINQQSLHQASHPQHPNSNLQMHSLPGHPGFGAGTPNNIFAPQSGSAGPPMFGGVGGLGGGGTGLASHAAQMSFAHGASLQVQQAATIAANALAQPSARARDVWSHNLDQEFAILRELILQFPYISVDTAFPGVVARPIGNFPTKASYHYQTLRANVDLLKVIQMGITLFSIEGDPVPSSALRSVNFSRNSLPSNISVCPCTWTFHFQFSTDEDMCNDDLLALMKKIGADMEKHKTMGIDRQKFGALLMDSGLILDDDVHWISFHAGYDIGYLLKLVRPQMMPPNEEEFQQLVRIFFPNLWDVKFILRQAQRLNATGSLSAQGAAIMNNVGNKAGLHDMAEELGCQRIGVTNGTASDAHMSGSVFFQMRGRVFDGQFPGELNGEIWGLTGVGEPASSSTQAAVLAAAQGHAAAAAAAAASNGMASAMGYHTGHTPGGHRDGGPSTPTTNPAGLATTPGPSSQGYQSANLTPGAGGVFGNFQYGK